MTKHKIILGDSRNMQELPDNSISLAITSPPYWQLKDYGTDNQIGYNDSYEKYINHLNIVWQECFRVLESGSRLCVNIGDQFARSVYYGRYKVMPIRTEIIKFCEAIGFDYMGAIIWQKKTTSNTTGGASLMGSYPFPKNGIISIDYEFILIFKKLGTPKKPSKDIKDASKMSKDEWKTYFNGHWYFGGARQDGHIAMFPEELPKRLIKMFSFVGDTVLDPFLGSGTTTLAANNLHRKSIGYEVNSEHIPFIEKKLNDLFQPDYELIYQKHLNENYDEKIKNLPYVFKDFHSFNLKTDPKKLLFGSKIDRHSPGKRQEYFSVKELISPELLRLNNNMTIRLIGIKERKEINGKALAFLRLKTLKQKVFLKYDAITHDENNYLMVYLYLKNKTFINAHLIKNGLADIDTSYDYRSKSKFIQLAQSNG